jgi:hypothetical protein
VCCVDVDHVDRIYRQSFLGVLDAVCHDDPKMLLPSEAFHVVLEWFEIGRVAIVDRVDCAFAAEPCELGEPSECRVSNICAKLDYSSWKVEVPPEELEAVNVAVEFAGADGFALYCPFF